MVTPQPDNDWHLFCIAGASSSEKRKKGKKTCHQHRISFLAAGTHNNPPSFPSSPRHLAASGMDQQGLFLFFFFCFHDCCHTGLIGCLQQLINYEIDKKKKSTSLFLSNAELSSSGGGSGQPLPLTRFQPRPLGAGDVTERRVSSFHW